MLVEQFDQFGKISERAGQAIHLIDHHDIASAGSDVCKQLLQGGAFQGGTREGPVVVASGKEAPAFMGLALDVRFAGLPWASSELNSRSRLCSVDLRV